MIATEVIKAKREKQILTSEEIQYFIQDYTRGTIPDYQMSSLLMAIFLNGMSSEETIHLTQAMLDSGTKLEFSENLMPVDKHSTGGVGDKTSLILAPIVAACGVSVPMMSGRGLGHTGGTLDKLESIPGFNVNLSLDEFRDSVERFGLSYIGQTENICPADKKIYSLRDVTATVESLPLICASIMSKKIAEGIRGLVLDVKVGSGAFMKTVEQAQQLAQGLMSIGRGHNITTQAIISNMDQPLGRFVGNALEVHECISILTRKSFMDREYTDFNDTEILSLELAARMISIARNLEFKTALEMARSALESGKAYEKFAQICSHQSGRLDRLPRPAHKREVLSTATGWLSAFNTEQIGVAGINIGAGRTKITDIIDPVAGFEIHKKIGDKVKEGDTLFTVYFSNNNAGVEAALKRLQNCYVVSPTEVEKPKLILKNLTVS